MNSQQPLPKFSDVRQSAAWAKYLEEVGWKSFRTPNNVNVEIRKFFLSALAKVQKPNLLSSADIKDIEQICAENKAMFVKIEPYLGQDVSLLKEAGFKISWFPLTPTATYFIDLTQTQDQLWEKISHSGKYSLHRAEREGAYVEIYRKPNEEILREFYKVLQYTGYVKKIYVPPFKQLLAQAAAFGDNGFVLTVKDKQGNVCGSKWHAANDDMVLYVSGGTSAIGRKDKSGYKLLWESIKYFKSLGFKKYDLEGKDDKRFPTFTSRWAGFSHFKEKFGGDAIEFPHPYIKYLTPTAKFLNAYAGFNM